MHIADINPFMRFAQLQPSVLESENLRATYDYRLFYMVSGHAVLKTEQGAFGLSPGMVLFLRPGTPYSFIGNMKIIVLNFDLSRRHTSRKEPMPPSPLRTFRKDGITENDPPVELENMLLQENAFETEELFRGCVSEFDYPTFLSDAQTSVRIKEILCFLLQKPESSAVKKSDIIQKTLLYIHTNYDRDIDNGDISSAIGYHPYYLNRVLKSGTGMTIHQTLMHIRIRHAKELLRQTTLSAEAISAETGFRDRAQFCTAFRKNVGVTPGEYRHGKQKNA